MRLIYFLFSEASNKDALESIDLVNSSLIFESTSIVEQLFVLVMHFF